MLSVFARLKRRLALAFVPAVRAFPDGFAALGTIVPWDDVSRVLAHAEPDGMRIEVRAAHLDEPVVLAEAQPGFGAFVRMADRRLGFPPAWREALPRALRAAVRGHAARSACRPAPSRATHRQRMTIASLC
jgi:hypothetical protein